MWIKVLLIAVFGALGAVARGLLAPALNHLVGELIPLGTLVVNVLGCLLAGVVMFFSVDRPVFAEPARSAVLVGFLGGLTTFSALGYESVIIARDRHQWGIAAACVGANVVLGLGAVVLGRALARAIWA